MEKVYPGGPKGGRGQDRCEPRGQDRFPTWIGAASVVHSPASEGHSAGGDPRGGPRGVRPGVVPAPASPPQQDGERDDSGWAAECLDTLNGPDLHVYLSEVPAGGDARAYGERFVDLGKLKGNKGNQNYRLPVNVDLSRYRSAVIWCKRFTVGFGVAPLS